MTGLSGSALLPTTFEERGAVVPFTTPALSLSRVRRDARQRMILLMPNFGGTEGAFVIPWNGIAEVTTMSVHDRALHEEIDATESLTPEQLALAAGREAWRLKSRALLDQAGQRLRTETAEIQGRISALARMLLPLGLSATRQHGRLRRLIPGFGEFRDAITEWGESEKSELAPFAGFAGFVADDTLKSAEKLFGQLDAALRDMASVIGERNAQAKLVATLAGKLCWLLDGWEFIFAFWEQVRDDPIEIQREAVGRIIRVLPLIPRHETELSQHELEQRQQQLQGRQIPANADWRRARSDLDLVARIEAAKAKVVAP
jgi:hypothetical protein